ncbi:hypothetical protein ACOI1H_13490 [Loktanella sp. DJP18]|uniref:hypothetical protein n=1 Tax=Loktanella sp. DJP18 TaxID=3409788 RepID=UPI003BB71BAA
MAQRKNTLALAAIIMACAVTGTAVAEPVQSPSPDDLVGRAGCVAWRRDDLDIQFRELAQRNPGGWSISHQFLKEDAQALDAFEARHIRPWIETGFQQVLVEAYWPDGLSADPQALQRCAPYLDRAFLTAPAILGVSDMTPSLTEEPL